MTPKLVKLICVLLLLPPLLNLTACGVMSKPSVQVSPALPPIPQLSEPLPSEAYSHSAERDNKCYRSVVIGTSTTCAP